MHLQFVILQIYTHLYDNDLISSKCTFLCVFLAVCVMAELPSGLLEACVVVGASSDKLRDIYQVFTYIFIYIYIHTYTKAEAKPCAHKAHKVCKQTDADSIYIYTLGLLVFQLHLTYL